MAGHSVWAEVVRSELISGIVSDLRPRRVEPCELETPFEDVPSADIVKEQLGELGKYDSVSGNDEDIPTETPTRWNGKGEGNRLPPTNVIALDESPGALSLIRSLHPKSSGGIAKIALPSIRGMTRRISYSFSDAARRLRRRGGRKHPFVFECV